MDDAVLAGGRPLGEADELRLRVVFEKFGLLGRLSVLDRVAKAGGAAVVAFADHERGFELSIALELGHGIEQLAANFEVFAADLLLQGDGMTGDDEWSLGIDRVDQPRHEVGEAFTDASAGFEEQRLIGLQRLRGAQRHGRLLGAVVEPEHSLQVPAFLENRLYERDEVAWCDGGASCVFDESDHDMW